MSDLYFETRLAFVDRPDVRIYTRDWTWGRSRIFVEPTERTDVLVVGYLAGGDDVEKRAREIRSYYNAVFAGARPDDVEITGTLAVELVRRR